jgi:hypothetical protein
MGMPAATRKTSLISFTQLIYFTAQNAFLVWRDILQLKMHF